MFNVVRTVYGHELFLAGPNGSATSRLCTCDNMEKAERLIVWLSALNDITPLGQVLELKKAQPLPAVTPAAVPPPLPAP